MAEQKNNTNLFQTAIDLIKASCIREAIAVLRSMTPSANIIREIEKIEQTYSFLSKYMIEGIPDESRPGMYSDIKEDLFAVCDNVRREMMLRDNPTPYFSTARYLSFQNATFNSILNEFVSKDSAASLCIESIGMQSSQTRSYLEQREKCLDDIFDFVWTCGHISHSTYDDIRSVLCSDCYPFDLKSQIISALTFGLMQFYDRNRLLLLIDVAENTSSSLLAARALPGVVFTLRKYSGRILSDKRLHDRLALWNDSLIMFCRIRSFVKTMLRTRDTDRVNDKMKKEVMPELMKLSPDIVSRMRDFSADTDLASFEENPDWEERIRKSGLDEKLREISELQSDGSDVLMFAFSNLKDFPFFRTVSHWLLPFAESNSILAGENRLMPEVFSSLLLSNSLICNSDKFSFVLSLQKMPEAQRNMMITQMNAQYDQLKEQMADRLTEASDPDFDSELTGYMRDLYRFHRIFSKRNDFYDPFAKPLNFLSLPFIGDLLKNDEIVGITAEFYFRRGYYSEALPYLASLYNSDNAKTDILEKIGFCHQSMSDLDEAIKWYDRALSANGESLWLIKKLAHCYKMTGDFPNASRFYMKALEKETDNMTLLLNTGHALYECGKVEEAVKLYYKALYLHPESVNPIRAIAWCEMSLGHFDKADEYYSRIEDSEMTGRDSLNLAHLYLLKGDYRTALTHYRKALSSCNGDISRLRADIARDCDQLAILKEKSLELNIVLDNLDN